MQLLGWIYDQDWPEWDDQLESDIASGKLDFLAEEAVEKTDKSAC